MLRGQPRDGSTRSGESPGLPSSSLCAHAHHPRPDLPIELIALDIDGTLIGDDLVIGADTRAAVRAAMARGVPVSIVTGRMVSSAMRFALESG